MCKQQILSRLFSQLSSIQLSLFFLWSLQFICAGSTSYSLSSSTSLPSTSLFSPSFPFSTTTAGHSPSATQSPLSVIHRRPGGQAHPRTHFFTHATGSSPHFSGQAEPHSLNFWLLGHSHSACWHASCLVASPSHFPLPRHCRVCVITPLPHETEQSLLIQSVHLPSILQFILHGIVFSRSISGLQFFPRHLLVIFLVPIFWLQQVSAEAHSPLSGRRHLLKVHLLILSKSLPHLMTHFSLRTRDGFGLQLSPRHSLIIILKPIFLLQHVFAWEHFPECGRWQVPTLHLLNLSYFTFLGWLSSSSAAHSNGNKAIRNNKATFILKSQ